MASLDHRVVKQKGCLHLAAFLEIRRVVENKILLLCAHFGFLGFIDHLTVLHSLIIVVSLALLGYVYSFTTAYQKGANRAKT